MRIRTALILSTAATALALTTPALAITPAQVTASQDTAASKPAVCPEKALTVRAERSADPRVIRVAVTNNSARACTVDRFPTVTFGNLDGAALPVPVGESTPYRIGASGTAHAAVRTIADPADPQARRVNTLHVAADPSHRGRSFTATEPGSGDTVPVWEPVTTRWQPSVAAADKALADALG